MTSPTPSLRGLDIQDRYSKSTGDLLQDFYTPVLNCSISYDRAVGFFSSAILVAAESALTGFVARGGLMRIICSPILSNEDADAIYQGSTEQSVSISLNADLDHFDSELKTNAASSLLRGLIASGSIAIKIAIPWHKQGIFHSKIGVFRDAEDNAIAFTGSVNETYRGWAAYGNHEQIEVFRGWEKSFETRIDGIQYEFDEIWDGLANNLRTIPASRLPEVFQPRSDDLGVEESIEVLSNIRKFRGSRGASLTQVGKTLQNHQKSAIDNWKACDQRGIITFVTGGGKTFTAISAIGDWIVDGRPCLVLVPSQLLHQQWLNEIKTEIGHLSPEIITVGAGTPRSTWITELRNALEFRDESSRIIVLATYDSAQSDAFLNIVSPHNVQLLLVADECHRIGASENQKILRALESRARLGLSATPERFGDPQGTSAIFSFFGPVLEPHFNLEDAIRAGRLVPYQYWLKEAVLTDEEDSEFEKYTRKIMFAMQRNDVENSEGLDFLLRARAKIVKEAVSKSIIACDIVRQNFNDDGHWLLYCNSRNQMDYIQNELRSDGIDSLQYHSALDTPREETLSYFTREGGLLLAVKCLDEGVDIPVIDNAIVIASSTNPREYIQRRGRILRWSEDKYSSQLWDVIVSRPDGRIALQSDLKRALEIARCADNSELMVGHVEYLIEKKGVTLFNEEFEENESGEE